MFVLGRRELVSLIALVGHCGSVAGVWSVCWSVGVLVGRFV